jgi:hypothetical protein
MRAGVGNTALKACVTTVEYERYVVFRHEYILALFAISSDYKPSNDGIVTRTPEELEL